MFTCFGECSQFIFTKTKQFLCVCLISFYSCNATEKLFLMSFQKLEGSNLDGSIEQKVKSFSNTLMSLMNVLDSTGAKRVQFGLII